MSYNYYAHGDYNVICDICKFKFKRSQCRKQWDKQLACLPNGCWSPKNAADNPFPILVDKLQVKDSRPEAPDVFLVEGSFSRWGGAWLNKDGMTIANPAWGTDNLVWGTF